jgi:hypothetical protein
VIGSFENEGAVKETDAVALPAVAEMLVGAPGTPLFDPEDELRIGIFLLYLNLPAVIIFRCFPVIISIMTKDERTPDVTY